jgi:hypothetical protein
MRLEALNFETENFLICPYNPDPSCLARLTRMATESNCGAITNSYSITPELVPFLAYT